MGLAPSRKTRVHHRLAGRSDGNWLGQLRGAGLSHPGDLNFKKIILKTLKNKHLGRKPGQMTLLIPQRPLRDEHWEVAVFDAQLLDLRVHKRLDCLPNSEGPGTKHIAAGDVVVLDETRLFNDLKKLGFLVYLQDVNLGVPLRKLVALFDIHAQMEFCCCTPD